jgi:hypothetical protein
MVEESYIIFSGKKRKVIFKRKEYRHITRTNRTEQTEKYSAGIFFWIYS